MEQGHKAEKQRQAIEMLERLDYLAPSEKATILCVLAGARPAAFLTHEYHSDQDRNYSQASFQSDIDKLQELLHEMDIATKIVTETDTNERDGFLHIYTDICVGKDKDSLDKLLAARTLSGKDENVWDVTMGEALGYPPTAIEAYRSKKFLHARDFPEAIQDHPLRRFLTFCLSPDHWREELDFIKPWAEAVKHLSSRIYAEMMLEEAKF